MNLDMKRDEFQELLSRTSDLVLRIYSNLEERKVYHGKTPAEVRELFKEALPEEPFDFQKLLHKVESDVLPHATFNISPHYYGYIMSGGTYAGIAAEFITAALNQNVGKWHIAAASTELEQLSIRWIAEFIGYPVDTGGVLVSGGSSANLVGIAAGVRARAPFELAEDGLRAGPPLTVYASVERHSCIDKAVRMLGLGHKNLRLIPVRDDFTIDVQELEKQIEKDRSNGFYPVCVIANGGSVNSGAVDSFPQLSAIAKKHHAWFHIDAAYGGPAAGTEIARDMFSGIELGDSVALDPHKWLSVPYEAGCVMVKDADALRNAFAISADYLRLDEGREGRLDFSEYSPQLSRNAKGLKVWMTLKMYGASALRQVIEKNIRNMRYLGELIDASGDFERLTPVPLSVVCFRYRTKDKQYHRNEEYLERLNKKLLEAIEQDGRVFVPGTLVRGKTALRACGINHRNEPRHVEYLLNVLREIGESIHF
jgi:glutamate/tyrosine decarboxylase-like PLP-dependent enzyme